MKRAVVRSAVGVFVVAALLPGYVRERNGAGATVFRNDVADMAFLVNDQTAAGMTNAQGAVIITPESEPRAAILEATQSWNAISQSRIHFRDPEISTVSPTGADNMHVVSFQDTPENRDVVGDATAVTLFFSTTGGEIRDSDIYFNPALENPDGGIVAFSTNGAPGTFDILSTVLHELGHAFGLNHTNVQGATMFQFGRQGEVFAGTLTPDDIAFAVDIYPAVDGQADFGRIRGTALLNGGQPILGGAVAAVNPSTGTVIGGLTELTTGQYDILVPPGEYVVYLEPLNGPVTPRSLSLEDAEVTSPFQTTVFGAADGSQRVAVAAGGEAIVDFTATAGEPALDLVLLGVEAGQQIALGTGPRELIGARLELFLWGPGVENVTESGLQIFGPDVALEPGSVQFDDRIVTRGFPGALRFIVNVTPPVGPSQSVGGGSLATVFVNSNGLSAALTGALIVEAQFAATPTFSAAGVANAASFAAGPVVPGGLLSIFGLDMGPEASVATTGFDPATGLLATELGGVRVELDGIAAPLFFVSQGQLNLQAPYELAGRSSTRIVVSHGGLSSAGVSVPVAAAAPGLFVIQGTAGAILNQDSTLNTPSNPAPPGGAVIVFGTGQGVVSNPVPTGGPALGNPLSGRDGVTATVGGQPVTVLFAGLAPDFVGLLQVNLLLPEDIPTGDAVEVIIFVDGVPTQSGVTLSIGP